TSVAHRVTKKGTPFGLFTIEDYTGSIELGLYREQEYLRHKHMMQEGLLIFVKGTYDLNEWRNVNEVKIASIMPLSEVRQRFKDIVLTVPADEVNENLIKDIETTCQKYPGTLNVRVLLKNREDIKVELLSGKYKI